MSWLSVVVLLAVVASLVQALWGRGRLAENWALVRMLRVRPFLTNLVPIAAVMLAFAGLYQLPCLRWGWWTLLSGAPGNAMISAATDSLWVFAPFLVLLAVAMPQLVLAEEEVFRDGTRGWVHAVPRSLVFGLIHLVPGVPIAAASAGLAVERSGWRLDFAELTVGEQRAGADGLE
ncbi:hypothetical protein [Actinomycetospora termitidis]|uniref:Uncharacterized protein n=1 Tax=Actinomycetospora termitidis TaxID=3053470 RepID=A0ABT7M6U5_9PSEU|nr:hypothetical protein [Actinomycetospora sp. Odt1-22]MDL5155522.1 hypothetical protein [Actinomycetospora sp. Odt1-22]